MNKFKFESVQHGEDVYLERQHYKKLVDRFLLLQDVVEAALKLTQQAGENNRSGWYMKHSVASDEQQCIACDGLFDEHDEGCAAKLLETALATLQQSEGTK